MQGLPCSGLELPDAYNAFYRHRSNLRGERAGQAPWGNLVSTAETTRASGQASPLPAAPACPPYTALHSTWNTGRKNEVTTAYKKETGTDVKLVSVYDSTGKKNSGMACPQIGWVYLALWNPSELWGTLGGRGCLSRWALVLLSS